MIHSRRKLERKWIFFILPAVLIFFLWGCENKLEGPLPPKDYFSISKSVLYPGDTFHITGSHFGASVYDNVLEFQGEKLTVLDKTPDKLFLQVPWLFSHFGADHLTLTTSQIKQSSLATISISPLPSLPTIEGLEGYTDKTSYLPGEHVRLYLTVPKLLQRATVNLYDLKGQVVASTGADISYQQMSTILPSTNGFRFSETAELKLPSYLRSGVYLVNRSIPVIVRSHTSADVVVVFPSNTENAYCYSGGKSLYSSIDRPKAVSFLRPIPFPNQSLNFSEEGFKFFHSTNKYSIGYVADYDLDDYSTFEHAKVLVIMGHNEYWTRKARLNFDRFVDEGHHALILSGNTMWWQVRYNENAQLICYRDLSDPIDDPKLKTLSWWNPLLDYSIINSIGADSHHGGYGLRNDQGWDGFKIAQPNSPLLLGTGLNKGDILKLPTDEYDGAPIKSKINGYPVLDLDNFYKAELIGFDLGSLNDKETIGTFIAFQRASTSGVVINAGTTDWCSRQGMGGADGDRIKLITHNAIRLLLANQTVFSN